MLKRLSLLFICLMLTASVFACNKTANREIVNDNYSDARLTLYSFDGSGAKVFGIPNFGHAFVSVKNIGTAPIELFGYTLETGEEASVGTWGQYAHWGIWLNMEAVYLNLGRYQDVISLSRNISLDELNKIDEFMSGADTWTPFTNCSAFALKIWNLTADENKISISGLILPSKIYNQVKKFSTHELNRLFTPATDPFYKADGEFIYCEVAK